MLFSSLPKIGLNITAKRFARKKINLKSWPNDWVPFHWTRPVPEIGYYDSADLVDLKDPEKEDLQDDVRMSKELKKLDPDDPLRKMFSLNHARRSRHNKAYVNEHYRSMGLIHEVDYTNSLEAKIVNLTFALRQIYEKIRSKGEDNRWNGHDRLTANSIKYRRQRYLSDLQELHRDRYNRLVQALDIEPKDIIINMVIPKPYRKIQMRKLALEYAQELKEKKVDDFMKSIEEEKKEFEVYKSVTLKWIEEAEKELQTLEAERQSM